MSIRTRLLCIALLATLLPALLVGWRFVQERDRAIAVATGQLPAAATTIAANITEKIGGTQQLLYGLARAEDLDTADQRACSDFLSRVRDQYPQCTGSSATVPSCGSTSRANTVAEPAAPAAGPVEDSCCETILLVEDDPMVRRFAHGQLVKLGYTVVEASDGPMALEIVRSPARIDLLFTDIVMPGGMSGHALAELARQLRPTLPVLSTSGYTDNTIVHHGRVDRGVLLLHKAYRRIELAAKIREALGPRATWDHTRA